jgi:diguanylate cyclase (GGDEF)-like protein/PAS domain S-box-containing protein
MPRTPLRVAAIDDDEADLELLSRCLEVLPGYEIELLRSVDQEALFSRLPQNSADVIFLDYMLGETTGMEILRRLRATGNRTPVIMLTGQGDEHLAVELMKAGATDYLSKARLSPENLERVLRSAMRIDELERQAAAAEERARLAAKMFDHVQEAMVVTDTVPNILAVNPAFTAITGYSAEEALGKNPRIISSGLHDSAFYQNLWGVLLKTGQWKGEIWNRRKSGDTFLIWQTISAVKNAEGQTTHYVSVFFDITERKQREDYIRYRAYHDALTDLPNRHLFNDRLHQALLYARRNSEMLAVMFLDLDHFKEVNDTLGHDVGDQLLQEVATRLHNCVREGDTVSRFGGDEFVLLLPKIKQVDGAVALAQKILDAFRPPVRIGKHRLPLKTSIGISMFPKDGDQPEMLLKRADEAMYRAKQAGGSCWWLAGEGPGRE